MSLKWLSLLRVSLDWLSLTIFVVDVLIILLLLILWLMIGLVSDWPIVLSALETGNLAVCLVELALEHLVLSSEALVGLVELVDLVLQVSGLLADKLQLRHHLLHLLVQGLNLLLV